MIKKSLSWFLAVIMAFTVFGSVSLFKTDKAYADQAGEYNAYELHIYKDDGTIIDNKDTVFDPLLGENHEDFDVFGYKDDTGCTLKLGVFQVPHIVTETSSGSGAYTDNKYGTAKLVEAIAGSDYDLQWDVSKLDYYNSISGDDGYLSEYLGGNAEKGEVVDVDSDNGTMEYVGQGSATVSVSFGTQEKEQDLINFVNNLNYSYNKNYHGKYKEGMTYDITSIDNSVDVLVDELVPCTAKLQNMVLVDDVSDIADAEQFTDYVFEPIDDEVTLSMGNSTKSSQEVFLCSYYNQSTSLVRDFLDDTDYDLTQTIKLMTSYLNDDASVLLHPIAQKHAANTSPTLNSRDYTTSFKGLSDGYGIETESGSCYCVYNSSSDDYYTQDDSDVLKILDNDASSSSSIAKQKLAPSVYLRYKDDNNGTYYQGINYLKITAKNPNNYSLKKLKGIVRNTSTYDDGTGTGTTVVAKDTTKTVSFGANVEMEDSYTICQAKLNLLSLLKDPNGNIDISTITGSSGYLTLLNNLIGNPIAFSKVDMLNLDFMKLFEGSLSSELNTNLLNLDDAIYAVCEDDDGTFVPVTEADNITWEADNLQVVTLKEYLGDMIGEDKVDEIIEKIETLIDEKSSSEVKNYKIWFSNTGTKSVSIPLVDLLDSLDSMAVVIGTNATKNDDLSVTATIDGINETIPASVKYTVNESESVNGIKCQTTEDSAVVSWDAVENATSILNDKNTYGVFFEEVKDGQTPNHNYTFMFHSALRTLSKGILDLFSGEEINVSDYDNIAAEYGWDKFALTNDTSYSFSGLDKNKEYRVVVVAFRGYGDQIELKDGTTTYSKGATAVKGETTFTPQKMITDIGDATVTLDEAFQNAVYNGAAQTPTVKVSLNGTELAKDTDYTVEYKNANGEAVTECKDAGDYTVVITGKGDYEGTQELKYTISKADISNAVVTLKQESFKYEGSEIKPEIDSVKLGELTLTEGTDYTVAYSDNTGVGTGKVTLTGTGNFDKTVTKTFSISKDKISINNCTVQLAEDTYTYNGKQHKPAVTLLNGTTVIDSSVYDVTYPSSTKNVGQYTVTVTVKADNADYTGTATSDKYTVKPAATTLKSVTKGKKQFTAKWTAKSSQVTGYKLKYSTNKDFDGSKTVTITSKSTAKKTVKKLKSGKKYYVKVATYKTVGDDTYTSEWSKTLSVKVK